jgi:hypothetical protein
METQNVSAQLYYKQLPADPASGQYGCFKTGDFLSTCATDNDTDANIENAFQSQLILSEYYKSPMVFNTMKQDYMDKTMEGSNTPQVHEQPYISQAPPVVTPVKIPVGPRDFLSKSNFGSSGGGIAILIFIILIIILVFYLKTKNIISLPF